MELPKDNEQSMPFSELALLRQSVRSYSSAPVSRELIDKCLNAARMAPSACNAQPWSFVVVDDPATKEKVISSGVSYFYGINNRIVRSAPVLIAVITETTDFLPRIAGQWRGVRYNIIDVAIACDHLTLQAAALGLGTCWLGWFKEDGVRSALNLPSSTKIDLIMTLGYPEGHDLRKVKKYRKSLDQIRKYAVPNAPALDKADVEKAKESTQKPSDKPDSLAKGVEAAAAGSEKTVKDGSASKKEGEGECADVAACMAGMSLEAEKQKAASSDSA